MIKVNVDSVKVSMLSQHRVVVLREEDQDRYLPIWIGPFEADAITIGLQSIQMTRPLTHDLLKAIIDHMEASVSHIWVNDLKNDILKLTEEANQRFKHNEKEAKKMQNTLESHIEKAKKELKDSLESTRSQISEQIDRLIQEKSDRMQLGNLLIELGMKIKGEDLMETLKKEVEATKDE